MRFTPFGIQEPAASDDVVETISEADKPSKHSPEDTPVVDRTQVKIFDELAERLAEMTLHAPQTTEMSATVTQTIARTSAEGGGLFHIGGPSVEGDPGPVGAWDHYAAPNRVDY